MIRIYQATQFNASETMILDNKASHHVAHVLRAKISDEIKIFNHQGEEWLGKIIAINKKNVCITLLDKMILQTESHPHLTLAQSYIQNDKMDWLIQKAVELGINQIIPIIALRSQMRGNAMQQEKKLTHWQSIIIHACEQSGRNHLPQLTAPLPLKQFLSQTEGLRLICTEPSAIKHLTISPQTIALLPDKIEKKITVCIGPEGGFCETEISAAINEGFIPITLGKRILRAETAGMVAITLLQARYGDMQ